jgi:hypothetical protein
MRKTLESWKQSFSDSPFMCMDEKIMHTKALSIAKKKSDFQTFRVGFYKLPASAGV